MKLSLNEIKQLKNMISSRKPILSLYLSTDKQERDGQKKALATVKSLFKSKNEELQKTYDATEVEDLKESLLDYLKHHWPTLTNGTVFFTGGDDDIFQTLHLPDRMANILYLDKKLYLRPLFAYIENYDKYLVVALDKKGADVYTFQAGYLDAMENWENKFWSIMEQKINRILKEKNAEGVFARYLNSLEKHILDYKEKIGFQRIIIFIPEKLKPILSAKLSQEFKDLLALTVTGNYRHLDKQNFYQKVKKLVEEMEARADEKDIEEIYSEMGNSDYKKGVYGLENVLLHLNAQGVYKLILNENIAFPGYKNGLGVLYADCPPKEKCEEVRDLINEMIIKALESKATVNFVKDNQKLRELGNIAALVRFKLKSPTH